MISSKEKLANDKRLSLQAKGLMLVIMSNDEDNWEFYLKEITNRSTNGIDSTRSALNELEKYGYLIRFRERNDCGQLIGTLWCFDDTAEIDVSSLNNDNLTRIGLSNIGSSNIGSSNTNKNNLNNTNLNREERVKEKKKKKEPEKNLDFDFLLFINELREYLKPKGDNYPTLPSAKYGKIGLNAKNRLYNKDTLIELPAVQAHEIFKSAYENQDIREFIYKHKD